MSHVYHEGLPDYDADAILHDGCPECEQRATKGIAGVLELDRNNVDLLWRRMLNTSYARTEQDEAGLYRSDLEMVLGNQLYYVGVLLERFGEAVWRHDRFKPV